MNFKIKTGYHAQDFVSIDETELEMALYIFLHDAKAIFKNGVVRGKDIISITPDWHKALDINPEWKLQTEDWNEIKKRGIETAHIGVITHAKEKVQYLIANNQQHLIGKNVPLPKENTQNSSFSKELSEKFSINPQVRNAAQEETASQERKLK